MKKYLSLNDSEIEVFQKKIIFPNIDYPHYEPLIINGIIVHENQDINPMEGEKFQKSNYLKYENAKELFVSNYGRIVYDNNLLEPFIVGTFLHCLKIYIKNIDEFYVHRIVKETLDPIEEMHSLHVHHINNNALDNRLENLIWVNNTDHSKIHEFSSELQYRGRLIYNKNDLMDLFSKNMGKQFSGNDLINNFCNVFSDVIKDNTYTLIKENIILDITEKEKVIFNNRIFKIRS
jgi:hypothetical protein